MNCMKCGRDIPENQVFCDDCLAVMERYPVRPGTVIKLPRKNHPPAYRPVPTRPVRTPEETVIHQRHTIRWLWLAVIVLLVLFLALAVLVLYLLDIRDGRIFGDIFAQALHAADCFT